MGFDMEILTCLDIQPHLGSEMLNLWLFHTHNETGRLTGQAQRIS
jgi:hypothetical protein